MKKSLGHQITRASQAFPKIVPRTGVEPVISALKGRRPGPLDERGMSVRSYFCSGVMIVPYDDALCQAKLAAMVNQGGCE